MKYFLILIFILTLPIANQIYGQTILGIEETELCEPQEITFSVGVPDSSGVVSLSTDYEIISTGEFFEFTIFVDEPGFFVAVYELNEEEFFSDTIRFTFKNIEIDIAQGDTIFICNDQGAVDIDLLTVGDFEQFIWKGGEVDTSGPNVTSLSYTPTISSRISILAFGEDCEFERSVWIQLDSLPELVIDIAPVKDPYCPNDTVALFTPAPEDIYDNLQYSWRPINSNFLTDDSNLNATVVLNDTITYFRTLTNNACSRIDSILINVPVPEIMLQWRDTTVCPGTSVTNLILNADELEDIEWMPAEGLSCSSCEDPSTSTANEYMVQALKDGCPAFASMFLNNFNENITILLEFDSLEVGLGNTIDIIASTSPPFPDDWEYEWTFNGQNVDGNGSTISQFIFDKDNTVSVMAISPNGCPVSATLSFTAVEPEIEMPNAFSPNGDGLNDIFQIVYKNGGPLPVEEFLILNRWGEIVYNDTEAMWDGRVNNAEAASEAYLYRFSVVWPNGEIRSFRGEVTLLR